MKKDEAVPPEPAARSVLTARLHRGASPGIERTPAAAAPRPAVSEGSARGRDRTGRREGGASYGGHAPTLRHAPSPLSEGQGRRMRRGPPRPRPSRRLPGAAGTPPTRDRPGSSERRLPAARTFFLNTAGLMIGWKAEERRCPSRLAGRDWASRMRIRIGAVGGSSFSRTLRLRRMRTGQDSPTPTQVWGRCRDNRLRLRACSPRVGAAVPPGPSTEPGPAAMAQRWPAVPRSPGSPPPH